MEPKTDRERITALLIDHARGDRGSFDELVDLVYEDLRRIAHRQLRKNARGTLDTTGLVNEAYIRLVDADRVSFKDGSHFFATAAQAMRWIIVDRARMVSARKRGGRDADLTLEPDDLAIEEQADRLIDLDRALERLSTIDERLTKLVECRFFAGLSVEEAASALGISTRTADRDWQRAKAWLLSELGEGA